MTNAAPRPNGSITHAMADLGLLVMRIAFGSMLLVGHGWGKLQAFSDLAETFPDPLGIGSRMSLIGAISAEVVCSSLVVIGLATRLACLVLVFTFAIAALKIHVSDPFFMPQPPGSSKEPALLYGVAFLTLFLTGPGRLSIDRLLFGRPLRPEKYQSSDAT